MPAREEPGMQITPCENECPEQAKRKRKRRAITARQEMASHPGKAEWQPQMHRGSATAAGRRDVR